MKEILIIYKKHRYYKKKHNNVIEKRHINYDDSMNADTYL